MDVSSIKMMGENVSFQKQSNGIIAYSEGGMKFF